VAYTLAFEKLFAYPDDPSGIVVPISLRVGEVQADLLGKIDTGAPFCIFQRQYGLELGLEIETGREVWIGTAGTERFAAYGHSVTLGVVDYTFDTIVYFAKSDDFRRNVLGRRGWLDVVKLGLVDYDRQFYLSRFSGYS